MKAAAATVVASEISAVIDSTAPVGGLSKTMSTALQNVLGAQIGYVGVSANGNMVSNTSGSSSGGRRLSMIEEAHTYDTYGRRLQTTYKIYYEAVILATSTVRAETIVQKGVAMTKADTAEMNDLVSSFSAKGMTVSGITLVMAPRTFQTKVVVNSQGIVQPIGSLPVPDADPIVYGKGGVTETAGDPGAIIGGVIGGLVGVGCIVGMCYGWVLMRKRLRES